MKIKKGDNVQVIAGKDKGKAGKVLFADAKNNKVIVEGVNIVKKHVKPSARNPQSGIMSKEAPIDASNVMYLYNGKPVRIGYQVEMVEKDGKAKAVKQRIAKPSGDLND